MMIIITMKVFWCSFPIKFYDAEDWLESYFKYFQLLSYPLHAAFFLSFSLQMTTNDDDGDDVVETKTNIYRRRKSLFALSLFFSSTIFPISTFFPAC